MNLYIKWLQKFLSACSFLSVVIYTKSYEHISIPAAETSYQDSTIQVYYLVYGPYYEVHNMYHIIWCIWYAVKVFTSTADAWTVEYVNPWSSNSFLPCNINMLFLQFRVQRILSPMQSETFEPIFRNRLWIDF